MTEQLKMLKAMLIMAELLNYSSSYKSTLIEEIKSMIEKEENSK